MGGRKKVTEQEEIELIMAHSPEEILRQILPFIRYGGGMSALTTIRSKLDPRWYDTFDHYGFAKPRLEILTRFLHTAIVHNHSYMDSDDSTDFYKCILCKTVIVKDNRADHFRRCVPFIRIVESSSGKKEMETVLKETIEGALK
jgi:hypothetical protein